MLSALTDGDLSNVSQRLHAADGRYLGNCNVHTHVLDAHRGGLNRYLGLRATQVSLLRQLFQVVEVGFVNRRTTLSDIGEVEVFDTVPPAMLPTVPTGPCAVMVTSPSA